LGSIKGYGIAATTTDIYTTGYFTSSTDFDPSASVVNLTTAGSDDIFVHKMTQSPSTSVFENNIQTTINVFPNPSTGNFCISNTAFSDLIIMTNLLGNEVMRFIPASDQEYIDMSEMTKSIYLLIAINKKGL
jgi:hypothetical protein